MNKFFLIAVCLLVCSCTKTSIIHYEYKGVKISRLDRDQKTFFSYGYLNDSGEIIRKASVVVDYKFDDFLFGFILFHKNGKVEIIDGGGGEYVYAISKDKISNIGDKELDLESYRKGSYDSLYQISNDIQLEIKRNKSFGSKVKIER